jgi:uncharacterized protein (TIGR02246 family)
VRLLLDARAQITAFHQDIFDTALKGSRIDGEVKFIRLLDRRTAVLHGNVRVVLPGEAQPSPSRDSMQIFVAKRSAEGWQFEAVLNARGLGISHPAPAATRGT